MFHPIAIDLRTVDILFEELRTLYEEGPDGLEPSKAQYADFAFWQQDQLESPAYDEGIAFWKERLAGARPRIEWPIGREQLSRNHPAGYVQRTWSERVSRLLTGFAQAHETTDFQALLAGFSAFLAQYTGQYDLTLGIGVSLRQQPQLMNVIGNMLNMLPIRSRLSRDTDFVEHFETTRSDWQRSHPHQWIPLERIISEIGADRGASASPLYDVIFTYVPPTVVRRSGHAASDFAESIGHVEARPFDHGGLPDAICSLVVSATRDSGRVATEFEYDAARFESVDVERMADRFERTMERWLS